MKHAGISYDVPKSSVDEETKMVKINSKKLHGFNKR